MTLADAGSPPLPFDGERTLYERLVDLVSEGIYFVDLERRILFWNAAAEKITGYATRDVIGKPCADGILRHCNDRGEILCGSACPLAGTMSDGEPRTIEAYLLHHDGRRVPVKIRSSAVRDRNGVIVGCAELFVDASPMNAMLAELRSVREYASIDALAGIGNRRMIQERLAAFGGHRRAGWRSAGVIFFDIDDFKTINDTHGHDVGDRAIREVASTAAGMLRSFDTIGRWGGDEFVVIAPGVELGDIAMIAERLRAMVATVRIPIAGGELSVTISVGATVIGNEEPGEAALTRADRLMYASKERGRNRVSIE